MVNLDKVSLVRVLMLFGALLAHYGINVPEETMEHVATIGVSIFALYTAYKNNYLFKKGLKQKEVLENEGLK